MIWVELVTLLAILQFFGFGLIVGKLRVRYGVRAPAMSGNPIVERHIRVQQNTLEVMIMFLPSLWIASKYWSPYLTAGLGVIYIIGRFIYLRGYGEAPEKRHVGFGITMAPIFILILLALVGMGRALVMGI